MPIGHFYQENILASTTSLLQGSDIWWCEHEKNKDKKIDPATKKLLALPSLILRGVVTFVFFGMGVLIYTYCLISSAVYFTSSYEISVINCLHCHLQPFSKLKSFFEAYTNVTVHP